jgi:hypothetical protein
MRIPTGPLDRSYEIPGIAADPLRPGRLGLAFYGFARGLLNVGFVSSRNAGASWSPPQQLNAEPVSLDLIARTSGGRMVGDYISTSFVGTTAVPVFALATPVFGRDRLNEPMFSTRLPVG